MERTEVLDMMGDLKRYGMRNAYDETLALLELSTGKPKTTDQLLGTVYLRVDNNLVSDIVRAEIHKADVDLAFLRLVAPIDGVVTALFPRK